MDSEQARPDGAESREKRVFEHPLSERIRTFLRLELLLEQIAYHMRDPSALGSRAAMTAIQETSALLARGDVRSEVLKELERLALSLGRLKDNPDVNSQRLDRILLQLDDLRAGLGKDSKALGQGWKEIEFLTAIRNRISMPGGTCQFDLPGYHFWLGHAHARRLRDMETWMQEVEPLRASLAMLLTMIRGSATPARQSAEHGMYQETLEGGGAGQLIRIIVPADADVFPEVSGSRHRITIRFMEWPDPATRPQQTERDIVFGLTYCQL